MFLLYPNYRGMMFSDQSQVASMDLTVTPPAGTSLGEPAGRTQRDRCRRQHSRQPDFTPTSAEFTATLDLSALPLGTYQLAGKLRIAAATC